MVEHEECEHEECFACDVVREDVSAEQGFLVGYVGGFVDSQLMRRGRAILFCERHRDLLSAKLELAVESVNRNVRAAMGCARCGVYTTTEFCSGECARKGAVQQ